MTSLSEKGNTRGEMGTLEESRVSSQVQDAMEHVARGGNEMKCGNYIVRLHRIKSEA